MMGSTEQYLDWARRILRTKALSPDEVIDTLDGGLVCAADTLLHCKDRVVIIGMGKSGHIGREIAAMMTSTGTPAFFAHPTEATHGDSGMIADSDIVVVVSNSGESDEITTIISALKHKNITLVGTMACLASISARHVDIYITAAVSKEARPPGLVSTTSTAAAMAPGDALAVVLFRARAFTSDNFTLSHLAGSLSRRLLLRVADIMYNGDALPTVVSDTLLKEAIACMSEKGLGMLAVIDEAGHLKGVLADGDPCRLFQQRDNFAGLTVGDIVYTSLKTITADKLVTETLKHMQASHINDLPVTRTDGTLIGTLNMHDLLMVRIV